jgi:hydroxybutyrate-dimer hydrolase
MNRKMLGMATAIVAAAAWSGCSDGNPTGSGGSSSGTGGSSSGTGGTSSSSTGGSSSSSTGGSSNSSSGTGGSGGAPEDINVLPGFVVGTIKSVTYDGTTNDLLTGGLGKSGLAGAAPQAADPLNPTSAELRTIAIYNNYRALLDMTAGGGYGVLYGPNIDVSGNPTLGEGKIAGDESLVFSDDGTGSQNVTLLVQVPASFDVNNPCIVTGTSSGSRGIYGAIATSGEWGLKHGCAVAYNDKGGGSGVHDLAANTVNLIDGVRQDAVAAGKSSNFTAGLSAAELSAFNAATPNRVAVKHAHSQQNPEKSWGQNTLQGVELAFYVLNEKFGPLAQDGIHHLRAVKPENTIVIASSISNGAGAALSAAEQDSKGLIDGVAVAEPQIQPASDPTLMIKRGASAVAGFGKALADQSTLADLYQPCATLAAAAAGSPGLALVDPVRATNRCAALKAKGLLTSSTAASQGDEALAILDANGWESDATLLQAAHYALATPAIALTYVNTYARASVKDNLCGLSFGAVDASGAPTAIAAGAIAQIFATSNGVPPTAGITIINNNAVGGPLADGASVSASTGVKDYDIDGALCLRSLVIGKDAVTNAPLTGAALAASTQLLASIAAVRATGNLQGKPAVIVHGRADALIPVNHASRPYFGLNKIVEGAGSQLAYYEIANANHFDSFLGSPALPGLDTKLVPLHRYFIQALDLMYAHLKNGAPIPPSQVVRTVPRGGTAGSAPAINLTNVPPISASPPAADQIGFSGKTVSIPD